MKKVHSVSLNLRFMRIPVVLCLFFLLTRLGIMLCAFTPALRLDTDFIEIILHSGAPFQKSQNVTGVFSLMNFGKNKTVVSVNTEKAGTDSAREPAAKEETVQTASLPLEVVQKPGNVEVSNSTKKEINISDFLGTSPEFLTKELSVLIVHTHTTESYTPSEKYKYTPTDTDRTTDKKYNMVCVGARIAHILEQNGIRVTHDTTINDYPSYNGSYNRSGMNVKNAMKNDPSIKVVLDVHRDAIEGSNGEKVKHTTFIDGKAVANIMLVVGSDLSGLTHSEWDKNMNFAATLQEHIQSVYPGLMRPLNFRSQRFNQQLAPGAIIVEVGTNGNTLEEALLGAEYFANGLADYIRKND